MSGPTRPDPLVLVNRHTGERLNLTRFEGPDGAWLEIRGSLPPRSEGPPLHVHVHEDEGGRVISGTISATVGGHTMRAGPGTEVRLPKGAPHRWWNADDDELQFEGHAKPVVDLDRMLQAMFEVVNAGTPGRPPLFYMAQVLHRHRHTQRTLAMPRVLQAVLMPTVVFIGTVLGKYRGTEWPGCPARCTGAPVVRK